MSRDDAKKLLGGYATGTLTRAEEQALFAAALEDQDLFDALAKEQALRDLLSDPVACGQVLASLGDRPAGWWRRATQWMLRPAPLGLATACLVAVVGYGVWQARQRTAPASTLPTLLADNAAEQKVAVPPPAPAAAKPVEDQPARREPVEKRGRQTTPERAAKSELRAATGNAMGGSVAPSSAAPPATATAAAPPALPPSPPVKEPVQSRDVRQDAAAAPVLSQQQAEQVQAQQQPMQQQSMFRAQSAPAPGSQSRTGSAGGGGGRLASPLSVTYAVLRRDADGTLAPVDLQSIHAGDTVVLRLTPAATGVLSVARATQPEQVLLADQAVERAKTIDLPPLTLDQAGTIALNVRFAPPQPVAPQSAFGGVVMKSATPALPTQIITLVFN